MPVNIIKTTKDLELLINSKKPFTLRAYKAGTYTEYKFTPAEKDFVYSINGIDSEDTITKESIQNLFKGNISQNSLIHKENTNA
jgi:hypothetical protein